MSNTDESTQKPCEFCGKVFSFPHPYMKKRVKYCSRKCFGDHLKIIRRNRIPCTCQECGKVFEVIPKRVKSAKYCSKECTNKHQGATQAIDIPCAQCGKTITRTENRISQAKRSFCSLECTAKYSTNKIEVHCDYCGKPKQVVPHWIKLNKHHFCNLSCTGKYWKGKPKNGQSKKAIKYGPNWYAQRKLAVARDNHTCQNCHKKPTKKWHCQVHHIIPAVKFNGDYMAANDLLNLITLCIKCHHQAERGKIHLKPRML